MPKPLFFLLLAVLPVGFAAHGGKNRQPYVARAKRLALEQAKDVATRSPLASPKSAVGCEGSLIDRFHASGTRRNEAWLQDRDLFPPDLTRVESVRQIGDAMLIRQGGHLKLARMATLSTANSTSITLEGDRLIDGWRSGDTYFVHTRPDRGWSDDSKDDYFYAISLDLQNFRQQRLTRDLPPQRLALPADAGEVVTAGWQVFITSRIPSGETRPDPLSMNTPRYAFDALKFRYPPAGVIVAFDGDPSVLRINALNEEMDPKTLEQKLRGRSTDFLVSHYVDYSLCELKGSRAGLANHVLFKTTGASNIDLRRRVGGRDEEYMLLASEEDKDAKYKHRVILVSGLDRTGRRGASRTVHSFDLPDRFDRVERPIWSHHTRTALDVTMIDTPASAGDASYIWAAGSHDDDQREHLESFGLAQFFAHGTFQLLESANKRFAYQIMSNDPNRIRPGLSRGLTPRSDSILLEYMFALSPRAKNEFPAVTVLRSNALVEEIKLVDAAWVHFHPETLLATIRRGTGRTPLHAILPRKSLGLTLVPGLRGVRAVEVGGEHLTLIGGADEDQKPVARTFGIYRPTAGKLVTPAEPLSKSPYKDVSLTGSLSHHYAHSTQKIDPRVLGESPFGQDLDQLDLRTEKNAIWIEGPSRDDAQKRASVRFDALTDTVSNFVDVERMPIALAPELPADSPARHLELYVEHTLERESGKLVERSRLTAIDGGGEVSAIPVDGHITSAEVHPQGHAWKIIARGQQRLVARAMPTEVHWVPTNINNTFLQHTNLNPEPLFADAQIKFIASASYLNEPPRLYYESKDVTEPTEIPLAFDVDAKAQKRSALETYIAQLYGLPDEAERTPVNQNPITRITREDDLFFISTEATAHTPSKTFVWSLRHAKLLFTINNYQAFRDVGALRFYVGDATAVNNTTIAVFDREHHQFVTSFDFRKLHLAIHDPNFVRVNPDTHQIVFKTDGGLTRVFDEAQNSFVGLLPPTVLEKLEEFEQGLGSILNQKVFMEASEALYERDEFVTRLAESLVPNKADQLMQNTLILSSSGAGRRHVLREFMNRWISGELPQSSKARIIFLELDQSKALAGTLFRGQFARKFDDFRKVAAELKGMGYQIVIVIDSLQAIDETPHNFGEGDYYGQILKLSRDQVAAVLANVTPSANEVLSRQHQEFMGMFKNQVALEPLGPKATTRAIRRTLVDHGQSHRLDQRQIGKIIAQVTRLQPNRQLPGSAYLVAKALMAKEGSAALSDTDVQSVLARVSGIPEMLLDEANYQRHYDETLAYLNRRVRGQPEVVVQLVNSIFAFALGVNRADLPIARLLLPGMTGTGKTELSRALSAVLFKDDKPFLKIDGANYGQNQDQLGLARMIARHVRTYPFNIILLDEFEKMGQEARNVILSVADGSMTDESGNAVSTALTVLMVTTNAGADQAAAYLLSPPPEHTPEMKVEHVSNIFHDVVMRSFSPPILGRFDLIYPYRMLTDEENRGLVADYLHADEHLATEALASRYARKGIRLEFDPRAIDLIARKFVNLHLGARRLTSQIEQELLKNFLTPLELRGQIRINGHYRVTAVDDRFVLEDGTKASKRTVH